MKKGINLASKNGAWKGDNVGYSAIHGWVKRRLKKSSVCDMCKKEAQLDLANKSDKYLRDLSDWGWLCRRCHMKSDGRLNKFIEKSRSTDKKGEKSYVAKLKNKDILEIQKLWANYMKLEDIAKKYNVQYATIANIIYSSTWSSVKGKGFSRHRKCLICETMTRSMYSLCIPHLNRQYQRFLTGKIKSVIDLSYENTHTVRVLRRKKIPLLK